MWKQVICLYCISLILLWLLFLKTSTPDNRSIDSLHTRVSHYMNLIQHINLCSLFVAAVVTDYDYGQWLWNKILLLLLLLLLLLVRQIEIIQTFNWHEENDVVLSIQTNRTFDQSTIGMFCSCSFIEFFCVKYLLLWAPLLLLLLYLIKGLISSIQLITFSFYYYYYCSTIWLYLLYYIQQPWYFSTKQEVECWDNHI